MHTPVIFVQQNQALDIALRQFLATKNHLFVVQNQQKKMVGVVTIEDVIEEILGDEIVDEFDQHDDMRKITQGQ